MSRVYRPDEGEVQIDVKLRPAEETPVAIYTPAGSRGPAGPDRSVSARRQASDGRGRFTTAGTGDSPWLRTADARGQFILPTDPEVQSVAMVHPEGFLECPVTDLRRARAARLQAWGRVEGVWLKDGQPVMQRQVSLKLARQQEDRTLDLDYSLYKTLTDDEGHFVFPQVPAARLDVLTWQTTSNAWSVVAGSEAKFLSTGRRVDLDRGSAGPDSQVTLEDRALLPGR